MRNLELEETISYQNLEVKQKLLQTPKIYYQIMHTNLSKSINEQRNISEIPDGEYNENLQI